MVAAADCYNGCLAHSKELWGDDILTTRDYNEILARKDIDAVIIGTPDHWHMQASVDAMNAGKDVYCEKPMIHLYSDGPKIIEHCAQDEAHYADRQPARELDYLPEGEGTAGRGRHRQAQHGHAPGGTATPSIGAWDYTVPPDASTETCDWPRFLGTAPKIPFNGEHFFQWRKWKAYGSGVAGDLFVHLFSGTHFITGSHGPTRAMATGGLRFWKDGRDVPDVLLGLFDYPRGLQPEPAREFRRWRRRRAKASSSPARKAPWRSPATRVSVSRVPRETEPGLMIGSFTDAMQKQITAAYRQKYPLVEPTAPTRVGFDKYVAPRDYSDSYDHFKNFFAAVRSRQPVVEDAVFGFRAAGAALLSNLSYERDAIVKWDPEAMKLG